MEKQTEKKEMPANEIKTISIKDLRDGQVINVIGLASTSREFTVLSDDDPDVKVKKEIEVIVLLTKINGNKFYLPINEGTVIYGQIRNWIDEKNMSLPVKLIDENFTVRTSGKGIKTYYFFEELNNAQDYSSLFE